jgi:hypothetical protein
MKKLLLLVAIVALIPGVVAAQPGTIVLDPTTLSFEAAPNGPLPVSATFNISITSGTSSFHTWSVSDDAAWLEVSPAGGNGGAPISEEIEVSINTTSLPPAVYTSTITVTSTGVGNSPQQVEVSYSVVITDIPTLSEWGLILMTVSLLGWVAYVVVRRRKAYQPSA